MSANVSIVVSRLLVDHSYITGHKLTAIQRRSLYVRIDHSLVHVCVINVVAAPRR